MAVYDIGEDRVTGPDGRELSPGAITKLGLELRDVAGAAAHREMRARFPVGTRVRSAYPGDGVQVVVGYGTSATDDPYLRVEDERRRGDYGPRLLPVSKATRLDVAP